MLIDALNRGLDPEKGDCCITCGRNDSLTRHNGYAYCPKHLSIIDDWLEKSLMRRSGE